MSKKVIAVILSVIIAFSTSITVFAASSVPQVNELVSAIKGDVNAFKNSVSKLKTLSKQLRREMEPYITDVVLTSDNLETAVDLGASLMIKIIEKIGSVNPEPSEPDDPSDPTEPQPGGFEITIAELKKILSSYIFVKVDDIDSATRELLEGDGVLDENGEGNGVKYYVVTLEDGTQTVYIAVDIASHPEVFNYTVFKNAVEAIYEQQGKELMKDKDGNVDYLMSYEHIAGELAMHAIIYAVMNELIGITGTTNPTILKIYESAARADLNIDEARVPSALISILGVLLVDMFAFRFLKLFKAV